MKNIFSRKTDSSDLLIGVALGSFFTVTIGLFVPQIVVAEIAWGFAIILIIFLLFSRH